TPPTVFPADESVFVVVGDFNGDGKQDLAAAASFSPAGIDILLGDGAGNFSAPTYFPVGAEPFSLAVGDFDGDGKQDLAVADIGSTNVWVLLGDGAGNFGAPTGFPVGREPWSVAVGDFNGDSLQDLAVANGASNTV